MKKEGGQFIDEIKKVLKPIEFGPPVKNPKNKIICGKEEINALRKYLENLEHLKKEVFPKIKITFDKGFQPAK